MHSLNVVFAYTKVRFSHDLAHIFWSFGIIRYIFSYLENRILLQPALVSVTSVAHFITGLEQTQLNLFVLVCTLVAKDLTIHNVLV